MKIQVINTDWVAKGSAAQKHCQKINMTQYAFIEATLSCMNCTEASVITLLCLKRLQKQLQAKMSSCTDQSQFAQALSEDTSRGGGGVR